MISKIVKIRSLFSFIETFYGYYDVMLSQVPTICNQFMVGSEVGANSGYGTSSVFGATSGAGASSRSGIFIFLK
jgi:hypothetical protein